MEITLTPAADILLPFQLENSRLRGRIIRLSTVLDEILIKHHYPPPVARLTAEAATLSVLIGSMLKLDGIFTLQAKGDGPVSLLVADYTSEGAVRAYAHFSSEQLSAVPDEFAALLGTGYLAFTVDQGAEFERYQGIVDIQGNSLSDSAQHYFMQSEQLRTALKFFVRQNGPNWQAAAIVIQAMPADESKGEHDLDVLPHGWEDAVALLQTITADEMLDAGLHAHDVLFRLFHEDGVRVYDMLPLRHQCRCSYTRAQMVAQTIPPGERDALKIDGEMVITCEFCNSSYKFKDADLISDVIQ